MGRRRLREKGAILKRKSTRTRPFSCSTARVNKSRWQTGETEGSIFSDRTDSYDADEEHNEPIHTLPALCEYEDDDDDDGDEGLFWRNDGRYLAESSKVEDGDDENQ